MRQRQGVLGSLGLLLQGFNCETLRPLDRQPQSSGPHTLQQSATIHCTTPHPSMEGPRPHAIGSSLEQRTHVECSVPLQHSTGCCFASQDTWTMASPVQHVMPAHLGQHTNGTRHAKKYCVEVLLRDAVVLQQHTTVSIHVWPWVFDLRTNT